MPLEIKSRGVRSRWCVKSRKGSTAVKEGKGPFGGSDPHTYTSPYIQIYTPPSAGGQAYGRVGGVK